jgi:hypothetical protein
VQKRNKHSSILAQCNVSGFRCELRDAKDRGWRSFDNWRMGGGIHVAIADAIDFVGVTVVTLRHASTQPHKLFSKRKM